MDIQAIIHYIYGFIVMFLAWIYDIPEIFFIGSTIFLYYQAIDYKISKDCVGEELVQFVEGTGIGFILYWLLKITGLI